MTDGNGLERVHVGRAVDWLALIATGLVVAHLVCQASVLLRGRWHRLYWLVGLFDLNQERNVPTLFATALLAAASALLAVISWVQRRQGGRDVWAWRLLAFGFLLMVHDEFLGLHERFGAQVAAMMGVQRRGVLYFSWVVPGMLGVAVLGLMLVRFWWRLGPPWRYGFALSAVVYLAGAVGMEMLGAVEYQRSGRASLGYMLHYTVEETLEMAGIILLLRYLVRYLESSARMYIVSAPSR